MRRAMLLVLLLLAPGLALADVYAFLPLHVARGYAGPLVMSFTWPSGAPRDVTTATGLMTVYSVQPIKSGGGIVMFTKAITPVGTPSNQATIQLSATDCPGPGNYYTEVAITQAGVTDVWHGQLVCEGAWTVRDGSSSSSGGIAAALAMAMGAPTASVIQLPSNPSGTCNDGEIGVTFAGVAYSCVSGTWTQVTNSSTGSNTTYEAFPQSAPSMVGSGLEQYPFTETITCPTAGMSAYYTVDGSPASIASQEYVGPFTVVPPAVVRAICAGPGYLPSPETSAAYRAGSLFYEDATALSHVSWLGSVFTDSKSLSWTTNGTPTVVTAQGYAGAIPAGVNGLSDSNYYSLAANTLAGLAGDFYACLTYKPTASATDAVILDSSDANGGWWFDARPANASNGSAVIFRNSAGSTTTIQMPVGEPINGYQVFCFGRAGTTGYLQVSGAPLITAASGTIAAAAGGTRLGRFRNTGSAFTSGTVYEVLVSSATPTADIFSAQLNRARSQLLASPCDGSPSVTYYASPTGSGNGLTSATPGSLSTVQTLARGSRGSGNVRVLLAGGTYPVSTPWTFTSSDSGLNGYKTCYSASNPNNPPVISGAIRIGGWSQVDQANNIWAAQGSANTRELWVNGTRATRARTTARGFTSSDAGNTYASTDATLPTFARPQDLELVFTAPSATPWIEDRIMVASATRVSNTTTLTLTNQGGLGVRYDPTWSFMSWPTAPSYIENAYEFLAGNPGSWYLNPSNLVLYYLPRVNEVVTTADVELPVATQLLTGNGVSDVGFSGIVFRYSQWITPTTLGAFLEVQTNAHREPPTAWAAAPYGDPFPPSAVAFTGSSRIDISRCSFQNLGAWGLYLGAGTRQTSVQRNLFNDLGGGSMQIGDNTTITPSSALQTGDMLIAHNTIRNTATQYQGAAALWIGFADQVRVLHNEVGPTPAMGISLGWGWVSATNGYAYGNEIGWNRIRESCEVMSDCGTIYTLGGLGGYQNGALAHSAIHDNAGIILGLSGPMFVYEDDGSSYVDLYNNVFLSPNSLGHWYFENAATSNQTATNNFASYPLGRETHSSNNLAGISAALPLYAYDATNLPALAHHVVGDAGPYVFSAASPTSATIPVAQTFSPAPNISSFSASPSSITYGNSSALSWTATGGSTCSIDQGVGSVTCSSGTASVSPTSNTTYTLSETNTTGTVTNKVSVAVAAGRLLADDANTVAHVYWTGSAIADTKGNAWTMAGTVTQHPAVGPLGPGGGPYATVTRYDLATSLPSSGDFSVCVLFYAPVANFATGMLVDQGTNQAGYGGWELLTGTGGSFRFDTHSGTSIRMSSTAVASGNVHVVCGGRTGTSQVIKSDLGTIVTTASAYNVTDTHPARIGVDASDTWGAWSTSGGYIVEIWVSTTTPTDALFISQMNAVKAAGITSW
jgi:hypothetical protein